MAEARAYVQGQTAASRDETGWREGQQRAWLWTAVTAGGTVSVVRLSRGAKVARERLGERFWGDLVTERWSASMWCPTCRRQVCWAHLLRAIEAMIQRGGRSRAIGEALQVRRMFHGGHRVRDGTRAHTRFAHYRRPIRRAVERLLDVGQTCGVPKTDNAAARAIRPGGLWRKGRFGPQRAEGARFVDPMMTVIATLKQPHRHGLDEVPAACEAALHGQTVPSLLPTAEPLEQRMCPAA